MRKIIPPFHLTMSRLRYIVVYRRENQTRPARAGGKIPGRLVILATWQDDSVLDHILEGVGDEPDTWDAIFETIKSQDHARMLVLADKAEELGVEPLLCEKTRLAVRAILARRK